MTKLLAIVQNTTGVFYVKNKNGEMHKITVGEKIYEGDTIIPSSNNSANDIVLLDDNNTHQQFAIPSYEEILLNQEFVNDVFNNPDLNFNSQDINNAVKLAQNDYNNESNSAQFVQLDNSQTDVNSDLRQAEFLGNKYEKNIPKEQTQEESEFAQLNITQTDVNSDLRQASWPLIKDYEKLKESDETSFRNIDVDNKFTLREGASVDIVSDLRKAQWFDGLEEPKYEGEYDNKTDIPSNTTPEITNSIPRAVDDTKVIIKEGGASVNGQLLSNDIPGNDGLIKEKELKEFTYNSTSHTFDATNQSYIITTKIGKLTVNIDGTWTLDPTGITITEHTPDSFTYKIVDSNGDVSNSATQPFLMFDKDFDPNITATTKEDTTKTIILNDIAGDIKIKDTTSGNEKTLASGESIDITRSGDNEVVGKVTNNGDGSISFVPSAHYSGNDANFSYEVTRSDKTTIVNDSITVTVSPQAETKTTDTDKDNQNDVLTQGDKTYSPISESATYNYISLSGLHVSNEDDRGNSSNPFASELTTVKLSGVPVGFKFLYNDGTSDHEFTVTNVNDGVTIPFEYISTLQIKPTNYYAGEIKIEMRIITVDTETGKETTSTSEPDYLTIKVNNVADPVTINAQQAKGDEDAGRANGNTTNDANANAITNPENGIKLDITPTSADTSGREEFTIIISKIPDGGAIYYKDANGTIVVDANGVVSGSNSNVTVSNTGTTSQGTSGWQVTIADFDNNAPLTFIPPHNDNKDYTLEVNGFTKDGTDVSSMPTIPKTIDVSITGVADIPVHDTFIKVDSSEQINSNSAKNIYSSVVSEDTNNTTNGTTISFKDLYKESGLNSYDSDSSETLSVVITGLDAKFNIKDVAGVSFNGATGTAREWTFDLDKLADVLITTSKNYSGDVAFTVKHITTEDDGNSKTFTNDVEVLIKPVVEGTISSSTSVTEDTATKVNFSIVSGDSDESLDTVWINKADITGKEFTLYSDNGTTPLSANGTTIIDDGEYYKLSGAAINSVYIKYGADLGSADTSDKSFGIKYTVSDSVTVHGETFTDTNTGVSGVYNINLTSVTDTISVDTSNAVATNGDITYDSGAKTVTLNDTGSFTLDVNVTGDSDKDGSENFTRLVIEGVQRGITVDGATMGISGDKNIWFLDIPDTAIDADGGTYKVTFNVNNRINPDTDSDIKITAYSHDTGAATDDIQLASTNIKFIDNMKDGAGAPTPDIDAKMTVNNALITEDTSFKLSSILNVTADTVNDPNATATYSIAFKDLKNVSFDTDSSNYTINTYDDNGTIIYVITATGTQSNIDNMLDNIYFKPDENYNKNNATTPLTFNAVLTAYQANGYGRDTATVDFSSANNTDSVKPVTDDISSNVAFTYVDEKGVTATSAQEDGETTIKITFDTVDDPHYKMVQGAADSSTLTTIEIKQTSGIYGTLSWNGGSYTFDATHSSAIVPIGQLNSGDLKFTPIANKAGSASFSYTVYALEDEADNINTTTKSFSINVAAVADGINLPDLSGKGDEDSFIEIYADKANSTSLKGATSIDTDGSESITSMFIKSVPENFLIYIGDSHQNLATKGSIDGNGNYSWTINISGGIPKIWIKAPENWSSTTPVDLTLETVVKDGSSTTIVSKDFQVTVDSVVDGFSSVTPNDAMQTGSADTAINLNANAIDLDGSETGILTLKGLGVGATFKQAGSLISAVYDNGTDTYTIKDIDLSTDKLNKLTFQQEGLHNKQIDYTFKTIESDDNEVSSIKNGSFNATTDNVITDINTSGVDGQADRLELNSGGIDFSTIASTSIEKIDLTQNGDHDISNVTLADVVKMTEGSNNLIFVADDDNDKVQLKNENGNTWTQGADNTYGGETYKTYSNSGDPTVKVQISDDASVAIA
ncbi:beta strand repeat-containing protein [Arcobacter sp.]|uniref:beta strand repeat-containing protein n=1 Tax=Arcobacter sp. TaxID=1872629 RepID=UPI003C772514